MYLWLENETGWGCEERRVELSDPPLGLRFNDHDSLINVFKSAFQFLYFSMAWSGFRLCSSLTPSTILLFIPFFKSISISIFISLSIYLSIFISVGWNGFQCPHYNFDAACPMLSCHLISCQVPWWSPTILHRSIWPSSYLSLLLPFLVWVSLLEPLLFRISLEDDVITLHNPRQHPTPSNPFQPIFV